LVFIRIIIIIISISYAEFLSKKFVLNFYKFIFETFFFFLFVDRVCLLTPFEDMDMVQTEVNVLDSPHSYLLGPAVINNNTSARE
jgi:hypothetical protein